MNIKVLYHSTTGNTRKIAKAIASKLNVTAEEITDTSLNNSSMIDLLFIGDGIYFGKPSKKTRDLIDRLRPEVVKEVAVFGTYGGQQKIGNDLKQLVEAKGIPVKETPFVCKGQSWMLMNRKHPDNDDLEIALDFAMRMAKEK